MERAADQADVDPDTLEGLVLLESAGRADARAPGDLESAAGLTQILAETGYRPVNKQALSEFRSKFPVRPGETTITNNLLGGWRAVDKKWFDPSRSIMQGIESSLGVSTGS